MKKIIAFAAVCAFAVAVVSCGQKAETEAVNEETPVEVPAVEETQPADSLETVTPADSVQN
jgi:hypothetical protein